MERSRGWVAGWVGGWGGWGKKFLTALGRIDIGFAIRMVLGLGDGTDCGEGGGVGGGGGELEQRHGWL